MSLYNVKTTLKSYVSEQAYFPLSSPVRACVRNEGSKGLEDSFAYRFIYDSLRWGCFFRSLFALLRKALSGLIKDTGSGLVT